MQEQIVKTVVTSGNGGAVWVPKDWIGEEVVVTLPIKPRLSIKQRIIHLLEPYLQDIIAIGLFGSYARSEQTPGSDIDVLVITKEKDLNIPAKGMDIVAFTMEKLKKAIAQYPVMYYPMVQEAKPLINASSLEELKKVSITKEQFHGFLQETKEHLQSSKELLVLDRLDHDRVVSYSVIYSSMLRLKGVYFIHCFLRKEAFFLKKFKTWLNRNGINKQEFENMYKAYRLVRENKSVKNVMIPIAAAERLLAILEKEVKLLQTGKNA